MAVANLSVKVNIMDYKEAKELFKIADKKIKDLQLLAKAQDRILRGEIPTKAMYRVLKKALKDGLIKGQKGGVVMPELGNPKLYGVPVRLDPTLGRHEILINTQDWQKAEAVLKERITDLKALAQRAELQNMKNFDITKGVENGNG